MKFLLSALPWLWLAFHCWCVTRMSYRQIAVYAVVIIVAAELFRPAPAYTLPQPFMRLVRETDAPPGFLSFCEWQITECEQQNIGADVPPNWLDELEGVNEDVNLSMRSLDDVTHYGRSEWWAIPFDGAGDCEDFALTKRQKLMNIGWSSSDLLIAVTRDHAVLIARTPIGDLVLDNATHDIKVWHQTEYRFLRVQSPRDPRKWEIPR